MTPTEQRLARRIHNQRVALRQNWEIVEMRADWDKKLPIQPRLLKSALKHARDARAAKDALTSLIFMICCMTRTDCARKPGPSTDTNREQNQGKSTNEHETDGR